MINDISVVWKMIVGAILLASFSPFTPALAQLSSYGNFVQDIKSDYLAKRNIGFKKQVLGAATLPAPPAGMHVLNNSDGIQIWGNGNYVIENFSFKTANQKWAIKIQNHHEGTIIIRNNYFTGKPPGTTNHPGNPNGRGIVVWDSSNVLIEENHFEDISFAAVYVLGNSAKTAQVEQNIKIRLNRALNLQYFYWDVANWRYTAYFAAFLDINGPGNEISNNTILNAPGESFQTDVINIFQSDGTPASPLKVNDNLYLGPGQGGHYNHWGAGLQLADHFADASTPRNIQSRGNVFIQPGMLGMNINGGDGIEMSFNIVLQNQAVPGYLPRHNGKGDAWEYSVYAWTPMLLKNYVEGSTVQNKNHKLKGNRTLCSNCSHSIYTANGSLPPGTENVDNNFNDSSLSFSSLVKIDVMSRSSCAGKMISWGNDRCFGKVNAASNGASVEVLNESTTRGTTERVTLTCESGQWKIGTNSCR